MFLHQQIFIVCISKVSSFESQPGQTFKKFDTPRLVKCTNSKVNVRCRNFREESVNTSKPSKQKKYNMFLKKTETLVGIALIF